MTTFDLFSEILKWLLVSFPVAFIVGAVFFPSKK